MVPHQTSLMTPVTLVSFLGHFLSTYGNGFILDQERQPNFRVHMTRRKYFVDKSHFIKDIMEDRALITAIARPRKFGKSINLSMLYYFLTVNGRYSQLFQNLTIAKDRHFCRMHQNKHPTMSVRFGYNYWITYEQAIDGMRQVMHKLFLRNRYVIKSVNVTEPEKRKFEVILNKNGTHDETIDAIRLMTDLMSRYHHSRVILLVDAYDTSINRAFFHGFYSQMVILMRSALQRAMERNPFLLKAVVMGTTLVSYHGLFLGINFVEIHSVWSPKYQYCFGFTEEEVKKVLLDHNYNERALDNMREFYEGYYIGNKKMFNPYSVMNSLHRDGQTIAIKNLWVKSADPMDFIDLMLRHGILPILNAEILLSGQDIYKVVTAAIELPKIKDDEMTFWSYLTQTGYLAISSQTRRSTGEALRVPNREVALAFRNAVAAYYKHFNTTPQYEDFRSSLRDRNSTAIKVDLALIDGDDFYLKLNHVRSNNFRIHMEEGRYFVDKSYFVKELIEDPALVTAIARPRKFGKSINLSMLYYFLTINGRFPYLFRNLTISKDHWFCRKHRNSHPTLILSFGYNSWTTYEKALDGMKQVMSKLYERNKYVINSVNVTEAEKRIFNVILTKSGTHAETITAIRLMTNLLSRYHNKRVILLVDEYDTPINRAFFSGFYEKMVILMRTALNHAIEKNPFLFKAVIVGTTLISYEGLFLGINFVEINSGRLLKYSQCFGFTEKETRQVLLHHKYPLTTMDNLREFYAGYHMGNERMFNPLSVMHCVKPDGQPLTINNLWVKSADPMDFTDLMLRHGILPIINAEILLTGQDIYKIVTAAIEYPKIDYEEVAFWSYLTLTGYLAFSTPASKSNVTGQALRVPNREVALAFNNVIKAYYSHYNTTPQYDVFRNSLRDRNSTAIKDCLEEYVNKSTPFFHGRNLADFEGLMTGILRGVERDHGTVTKHREGDHTSTLTLGPSGNSTEKLVFVLTEVKAKERAEDANRGVKKMWVKFCRMFQNNATILSLSTCDGLFELRLDVK